MFLEMHGGRRSRPSVFLSGNFFRALNFLLPPYDCLPISVTEVCRIYGICQCAADDLSMEVSQTGGGL
jgi:hypothetical protein